MEDAYPERVIDVHCHLFNARYIPLKGVLESLGVPAWLAGPARDLLNSLTESADVIPYGGPAFFQAVQASKKTEEVAGAFNEFVAANLARRIATPRRLRDATGTPASRGPVLSALRRDRLYASLEQIRGLRLRDAAAAEPGARTTGVSELLSRLGEGAAEDEQDDVGVAQTWTLSIFGLDLEWLLDKLFTFIEIKFGETAHDYIRFLLLMLSSEEKLLEELLSSYRPEQNVDLFVHLMMDMQEGYAGEEPQYPFDTEQIDRMAGIVAQSDGKVKGFVAFDPRRENGLELVQYGLENGNCGVKLYPPMGYTATGEDDEQHSRLWSLYAYCTENDIPILTHCSPVGFEAWDCAGIKSSPEHWYQVLAEFPQLRLCYGHAGGDMAVNCDVVTGDPVDYPGWFVDPAQWGDARNFSRMVAEHCRQYEHVYCDFSYLTEAPNDATFAENFRQNLVHELGQPDDPYALGGKIMYGADWHMPSMASAVDEFLDFMVQFFEDPALQLYKERFFHGNAERFLGLG